MGGAAHQRRSGSVAIWAIILVIGATGFYFVGTIFSASAMPSCTMNGLGSGSCAFTNTDPAPWSICGHVVVHATGSSRERESPPICSGFIWPRSTTNVNFSVSEVHDLCAASGQRWADVCSFSFEKDK